MSKGIPFPEGISPSSRSYKPGVFPVGEFTGLNGAVTVVQYGNRKSDSELRLEFRNISDAKAWEICQHYGEVNNGSGPNGERNWAELSRETSIGPMAGVFDVDLSRAMCETRGNRRYRYAEPPELKSVFPGVCTVTVKFRGYIDGAVSK